MDTVFIQWQADNQMNPFFQLDRLDSREGIKYNLSEDRKSVTFDADGNDSNLATFLDGKTFKLVDWSEINSVDTDGTTETRTTVSSGPTIVEGSSLENGQSDNSELRPDKKSQNEQSGTAVPWFNPKRK